MENNMKRYIRNSVVLALLCVAMSAAMFATDEGYLYLLQGIPGHDYSTTTDPQFPVDVLLNDVICYQHGMAFGVITGPLTLAPGSYDVKLSVANALAPCSNAAVVESTVTIGSGKNVSAVLGLSQSGTPTLMTFTNNFASITAGNARIQFAQAADAAEVQVVLQNTATLKTYTYNVNPGALLGETLPSGNYTVEIQEGSTVLVPSTSIVLDSQSVTLMYAVGEASNNTVNLETKTIKNVI